MKRFLITLLISLICIPIAVVVVLYVSQNRLTEAESVPAITLQAGDKQYEPDSYTWYEPVFTGMTHKEFVREPSAQPQNLGTINATGVPLVVPEGYNTEVKLTRGEEEVWSGTPDAWNAYALRTNGDYILNVSCTKQQTSNNSAHGSFVFRLGFSLNVEPTLETSPTSVNQGDVVVIRLSYLQSGAVPTIESDLPATQFFTTAEGQMTAYVPTGYSLQTPDGEYYANVAVSGYTWQIPITVTWVDQPKQYFTVEEGEEAPTINNPANRNDYKNNVLPTFESTDTEKYWQGIFNPPLLGNTTVKYSAWRYLNGSVVDSYFPGIDITAPGGTGIVAAAAGRVVYAGSLDATGNTVVIDHGQGLKTVYCYMESLNVTVGDMVARGQIVGAVGTTGDVKNPYLHFEVVLGTTYIDPALVLDGQSGLYYFE